MLSHVIMVKASEGKGFISFSRYCFRKPLNSVFSTVLDWFCFFVVFREIRGFCIVVFGRPCSSCICHIHVIVSYCVYTFEKKEQLLPILLSVGQFVHVDYNYIWYIYIHKNYIVKITWCCGNVISIIKLSFRLDWSCWTY